MKNAHQNRAAAFTKKYLAKLLLLAVVLTAGFSLRFAAQAKYTSYLYDYTGAVADDFCFTSNYLKEKEPDSEESDYKINGWDGKAYSLSLELRNFENSLRFNKADVDTCFYIETKVERFDPESETWVRNDVVTPACTLSDSSAKYDNKYPCVLLEGMDVFSRKAGTSPIVIKLDFNKEYEEEDQRLTVTVRTVPPALKDKVTGLDGYTGYGVFDVTLSGVFELSHAAPSRTIKATCTRPDTNSREIVYSLKCESLSGTGVTKVRVYYDTEKMQINPNLLLNGQTVKTDEHGTYFEVKVQSNSMERISFLTADMASVNETTHYVGEDIHYMTSLDETGEYDLWFAVDDGLEEEENEEPGEGTGGETGGEPGGETGGEPGKEENTEEQGTGTP